MVCQACSGDASVDDAVVVDDINVRRATAMPE